MIITVDYGYDREGSHYYEEFRVSKMQAQIIKAVCEKWEKEADEEEKNKN